MACFYFIRTGKRSFFPQCRGFQEYGCGLRCFWRRIPSLHAEVGDLGGLGPGPQRSKKCAWCRPHGVPFGSGSERKYVVRWWKDWRFPDWNSTGHIFGTRDPWGEGACQREGLRSHRRCIIERFRHSTGRHPWNWGNDADPQSGWFCGRSILQPFAGDFYDFGYVAWASFCSARLRYGDRQTRQRHYAPGEKHLSGKDRSIAEGHWNGHQTRSH